MEKVLIVDGNSILNRAFYGIRLLTNQDGLYTNAIYGKVAMVWPEGKEKSCCFSISRLIMRPICS